VTSRDDARIRKALQGADFPAARSTGIGDEIVTDDGRLLGILTDRDITVRVVAADMDGSTSLREVCRGEDLATVTPETPVEQAAQLMREKAVRRLPVLDGDRMIGVVSLGDLAIEQDEGSARADISAAETNR
jgi:CBS domain-containing protein